MTWLGVARGLGKTIVEAAASRARHVSQNAVERHAAFFVGVETAVEKVAQEAAVLRDALAINAPRGKFRAFPVLRVAGQIAHRRKAQSGHHRRHPITY